MNINMYIYRHLVKVKNNLSTLLRIKTTEKTNLSIIVNIQIDAKH